MDSTSNTNYWDSLYKNHTAYPTLNSNINCDVVVVGGGLAGCLTCYYLSQYNISTVLIEKNKISSGNTNLSDAIFHVGADKSFFNLIDNFGEKKGVRIYKLCQKAIDDLENILSNMDKMCDFQRKDILCVNSNKENHELFRHEYTLRKKFGFDVSYLNKLDIESKYSFSYEDGIYHKNCAQLNPLKLCHALLRISKIKNARIYENTPLINYDYFTNYIRVNTPTNNIICKKLVFASGISTLSLLKQEDITLKEKVSIVTNPLKDFRIGENKYILFEYDNYNIHIRTTSDNRIMVCGTDTNSSLNELILLKKLKNLFPYLNDLKIEYIQTGSFISTTDNLPYIGQNPNYPDCYFNLPFGSNGETYSIIGAQIIKDLILYNNNCDSKLFRFGR